ncbi:MAG: ribosome biogenesis GTPase YlqF [Alicyclobacillus sp.]|nr:ribosome biogenesis GTPase YlqF [Alicyclobacillus sp.]
MFGCISDGEPLASRFLIQVYNSKCGGWLSLEQIHWFPGHMAKARREIAETLRRVDAVLELLDARLPHASANPMLRAMMGNKPRVVVLTRTDLADPEQTKLWVRKFEADGAQVVTVDAKSGTGTNRIVPALEVSAAPLREREARRGIRPRPLRTMVVGIPNVGKSTVINRLAGRSAAKTGDRPGITQSQQWIRLGTVELLDTPGVLWPKLDDEAGAYALAMSGAIKSNVLDPAAVCAYFVLWAAQHYPDAIPDRYGVTLPQLPAWSNQAEAWQAAEPVLEQIGRQRGILASGGVPDTERTAEIVLRELQTGKLGRMTFEWCHA